MIHLNLRVCFLFFGIVVLSEVYGLAYRNGRGRAGERYGVEHASGRKQNNNYQAVVEYIEQQFQDGGCFFYFFIILIFIYFYFCHYSI